MLVKRFILLIVSFCFVNFYYCQTATIENELKTTNSDPTGYLSMGARNAISFFTTNGKTFAGTGAGGQFALRISKNFNSQWFSDWVTSNIDNLAERIDFHSGFSMMPQIFSKKVNNRNISFFPIGGFCIDYTKFNITTGTNSTGGPRFLERYSFAAQAGFGATLPVSEKLNFSITAHYMLHIGTDVDFELEGNDVLLYEKKGTNLEGHYLIGISMDYKLFRLWQKK